MLKGCLIHLVVKGSKCFLYTLKEETFSRVGVVDLQPFIHHNSGQVDILVLWPYFS